MTWIVTMMAMCARIGDIENVRTHSIRVDERGKEGITMRTRWTLVVIWVSMFSRIAVLAQSSPVTIIELNTKKEYVLIQNEGVA